MDATPGFNPFNPISPPSLAAPRPDEILTQLDAIAKSGKIPEQPLKILRYVIDEALAGRAENITEFSVGVDALARSPSGKDTSLVRTHVSKLRSQLADYYDAQEKWRARVLIEIPKGGYRPRFSYPDPQEQFTAAETDALLSAQTAFDRLTLPAFQAALDYLDEILKLHPNHPLVLAMKADVHSYRAMHGLPPRQEIETARRFAERALEISPGLWQAQTAYGYVQAVLRHWNTAREAFAAAAAVPKAADFPAHPSYVAYLASQGKLDEAVSLVKQIVDAQKGYYGGLAPSKPIVRSDLGFYLLLAGRLEEARATLDSAMKDSDFYLLPIYRALVQEALNDPKEALRILRTTPLKWSETAATWGFNALYSGLSGAKLRARLQLWKLQGAKNLMRVYVPASQFVLAYVGLGEHQKALRHLRQMVEDCDPLFLWIGSFSFLRHLSHLPEFHAILEEAGLVWQWRRR